ncbi:MAG: tetratricopeptide repeat protein [Candidatus Eremiobacteraeota bacterium]|nr:tetratricopeptide repeat protein [Candidatus Eremiobacteraeota bacterium]
MDYPALNNDLDAIGRKDEAIFRCKELIRQARDSGDYHYKLFFEGKLNAINGLFDDALLKIRKAIDLEPQNPVFLLDAGICSAKLNKFHEALAFVDQALAIDGSHLRSLMHRASLLAALGDLRGALGVYDSLAGREPENLHLVLERAIVLRRMGFHDLALDGLEHVLAGQPRNFMALLNLAIVLDDLEHHDEALEAYGRARAVEPSNPALLGRMGILCQKLGNSDEALRYFDSVLTLEPQNYTILYHKGLALAAMGNHPEAIELFEICIAADPYSKESWKSRGESLTKMGDHEKALASFEEAIRIDTSYLESLVSKVSSLNMLGNWREALEEADKVLGIDSDQPGLYLEKGFSYYYLGMPEKAIEAFDMVLRKVPGNVKARYHKGLSLEKLGRFKESQECFRHVLREVPQDMTALHHLGYSLFKEERYREALAVLDEALLVSPNNPEVLSLKGFSLFETHRFREALAHFNRVLELNEGHSPALLAKARALAACELWEEASASFERYYQRDPGNAAVLAEMGKVLARRMLYREAIACFDRSLELHPKNVEVMMQKVVTLELAGEYDDAARLIYRVLKALPSSDARRPFFEFKYEYLRRYKRKETQASTGEEKTGEELHEALVNNILNEFWKYEIEERARKSRDGEHEREFIATAADSEEPASESDPFLAVLEGQGYFLRAGSRGILVNPAGHSFSGGPFSLRDIDAVVVTSPENQTASALEMLLSALSRARGMREAKVRHEQFLAAGHKVMTLLRDKEKGFDEAQRLLQAGYSLREDLPYRKLDLFVTPEVFGAFSGIIARYRDFVQTLHILDVSPSLQYCIYDGDISMVAFPGRAGSGGQEYRPVNLLIYWRDRSVLLAKAPPEPLELPWDRILGANTLLLAEMGSLERENFDITRSFPDRFAGGRTGVMGLALYHELFSPRLIVLTRLEKGYEEKAGLLCRIVASTLQCPCITASPGMELSLIHFGPLCQRCTQYLTSPMLLERCLSPAETILGEGAFFCDSCSSPA